MNLWQEIVTSALLGTERKPFAGASGSGAIGELLSRIDVAENEAALLNSAAVVALHNQAGRMPFDAGGRAPTVCEADEMATCSERASQHLALMLGGTHRNALSEWLTLLASTGGRVSEALLPGLLNYGIANREYRDAILAVLGKRGLWLAAQNPDWSYVTSANLAEEVWQTGGSEERLIALQQLRKQDAAKALELVAQSWQQEGPQDRARFIEALRVNLSMNDEPFLESALDDKRKEVRRNAAELLLWLPESRLVKRMMERALPLFEYKAGKRARLEVSLPEECDKAMTRDVVDSSTPYWQTGDKLGQRATWLYHILGAVPIQFWRERWNLTAEEILRLSDETEWQPTLIGAFANAAVRFGDIEMGVALLKYSMTMKKQLFDPVPLLNLCGTSRQEEILVTLLQSYGAKPAQEDSNSQAIAWAGNQGKFTLTNLLNSINQQWSEALTRTILDFTYQFIKAGASDWKYGLQLQAFYMSPAVALEEIAKWEFEPGVIEKHNHLEQVEAILHFRSEMLEELVNEKGKIINQKG